ncbi:hypothetical protein GGI21_005345, partial [Coemansia aciculifera]
MAITAKTRFVDLPADVQQMLESIERTKQAQIQVGTSIQADTISKAIKQMTGTVQHLGQDLHVTRMTLGSDRHLVDETRAYVGFALKHASKGASLIEAAFSNDNAGGGGGGGWALQQQQQQQQQQVAGDPESDSGDHPFEAVRRLQMASVHCDAASDYYWAWLSRAESGLHVAAERLDQLERRVATTTEGGS